MNTKDHALLVVIGHVAWAALNAVGVIFVAVFSAFGWSVAAPEVARGIAEDPNAPPELVPFVGTVMALVIGLVLSLVLVQVGLSLATAIGVWRRRSWSKIVGVIASVLALLNFPLGMLVGVYSMWFLLGPQGRAWLEGRELQVHG